MSRRCLFVLALANCVLGVGCQFLLPRNENSDMSSGERISVDFLTPDDLAAMGLTDRYRAAFNAEPANWSKDEKSLATSSAAAAALITKVGSDAAGALSGIALDLMQRAVAAEAAKHEAECAQSAADNEFWVLCERTIYVPCKAADEAEFSYKVPGINYAIIEMQQTKWVPKYSAVRLIREVEGHIYKPTAKSYENQSPEERPAVELILGICQKDEGTFLIAPLAGRVIATKARVSDTRWWSYGLFPILFWQFLIGADGEVSLEVQLDVLEAFSKDGELSTPTLTTSTFKLPYVDLDAPDNDLFLPSRAKSEGWFRSVRRPGGVDELISPLIKRFDDQLTWLSGGEVRAVIVLKNEVEILKKAAEDEVDVAKASLKESRTALRTAEKNVSSCKMDLEFAKRDNPPGSQPIVDSEKALAKANDALSKASEDAKRLFGDLRKYQAAFEGRRTESEEIERRLKSAQATQAIWKANVLSDQATLRNHFTKGNEPNPPPWTRVGEIASGTWGVKFKVNEKDSSDAKHLVEQTAAAAQTFNTSLKEALQEYIKKQIEAGLARREEKKEEK